jgi:GTPase SAR1 family protein
MGREAEVNGNQHTTAHLNGSSFTKWLSSRTYVPSLGVFGLDNAGKSCLLSWILQEEHVDLIQKSQRKFKSPNAEWIYPTVGFETHRFLRNGKEWQAVDLAGEGRYRSFWQVFAEKVDVSLHYSMNCLSTSSVLLVLCIGNYFCD